jgi:hypothetical protein
MNFARPMPPEELCEPALVETGGGLFVPAIELGEWIRETFIDGAGPLVNDEHEHLRDAKLGFLWTNVENLKDQVQVVGTAELALPVGGKVWHRGRTAVQLSYWFGEVPDFLITLYAPFCAEAEDAAFCATCEHELLHCSIQRDRYGEKRFDRISNRPIWGMRAHDVEEFVSIVERWRRRRGGEDRGTGGSGEQGAGDCEGGCCRCVWDVFEARRVKAEVRCWMLDVSGEKWERVASGKLAFFCQRVGLNIQQSSLTSFN